jgi:hypothetical protein
MEESMSDNATDEAGYALAAFTLAIGTMHRLERAGTLKQEDRDHVMAEALAAVSDPRFAVARQALERQMGAWRGLD